MTGNQANSAGVKQTVLYYLPIDSSTTPEMPDFAFRVQGEGYRGFVFRSGQQTADCNSQNHGRADGYLKSHVFLNAPGKTKDYLFRQFTRMEVIYQGPGVGDEHIPEIVRSHFTGQHPTRSLSDAGELHSKEYGGRDEKGVRRQQQLLF